MRSRAIFASFSRSIRLRLELSSCETTEPVEGNPQDKPRADLARTVDGCQLNRRAVCGLVERAVSYHFRVGSFFPAGLSAARAHQSSRARKYRKPEILENKKFELLYLAFHIVTFTLVSLSFPLIKIVVIIVGRPCEPFGNL